MANEENKRDYKGWISLVIGACAVWIAYESFVWQKNQSGQEPETDAAPGQQSTGGPSESGSSSETYTSEPTESEDKPVVTNPGHDKGNKKNKKDK